MNEASFEIVMDVLAREIDMLRYQLKAAGEENAKLRAMIEERDGQHE